MRYSVFLLTVLLFALATAVASAPVSNYGAGLHVLSRRTGMKVSDIKSLGSMEAAPGKEAEFSHAKGQYNHFKALAVQAASDKERWATEAESATKKQVKDSATRRRDQAQRSLNEHVKDAKTWRSKVVNASMFPLYESD